MDEEIEPWIVQMWSSLAAVLAVLFLLVAFLVGAGGGEASSKTLKAPQASTSGVAAALSDRARFLRLVQRQCAFWAGEKFPSEEVPTVAPVTEASSNGPANDPSSAARRRLGGTGDQEKLVI
eukprot:CAMPEP_0117585060 /NCGR_PEP_ID=MMETSP0784-20121206/67939_1 /TAXON_ID=39447 /ORGANISM="" /LENGTH=121 /DNA_ID=CAMNT_0005385973 /DNA_START=10 /DNA_END=375 /DNA_ORIENTATION=-